MARRKKTDDVPEPAIEEKPQPGEDAKEPEKKPAPAYLPGTTIPMTKAPRIGDYVR